MPSTAAKRPYNQAWKRARLTYLARHPTCVMCVRLGRVRASTVVDHIIPHRGDSGLFWDSSNWQALCKTCHDAIKQALEASGVLRGCGADGLPLDPNHHWN